MLGQNLVDLSYWISVIQALSAGLVVIILLFSKLAVRKWSRLSLPRITEGSDFAIPITLVLPTWNEEMVIEAKLNCIEAQDYPKDMIEVIIIDSNSDDRTVEISRDWIENNGHSESGNYRIIEEESRRGKSSSINRAFQEASHDSKVLMMSDIDCRLHEGALRRVAMWFNEPTIGAVTGRQILINLGKTSQVSQEEEYRGFFSQLRIAESRLDSTPIFHGECAAYRREAIAGHRLIENANADDSQMAVAARRSGFRSIYDPDLTFFEASPPNNRSVRIQKVRRAQGLIRHFWRNRGIIVDSSMGDFRKIMALEFALHIILPIAVVLGFLSGFAHIGSILINLDANLGLPGDFPLLESVMLFADAVVFVLLLCGLVGFPAPASKLSLTFFNYMMTLFQALVMAMAGKSLHQWQQVPSVREALTEFDSANESRP